MADQHDSSGFEHQVLNQALALADLGYRELYVRPWRKEPALPDWPSAATTDPVVLRRWFSNGQQYNLGLACGPQPNGENIVVIDIDPKNGGFETWNALVAAHEPLPDTPMTETPSGGFHIYTNAPTAIRNSVRLGQGIDIRGAGGQVLMPPSRLMDADGVITNYRWIEGMALGQLAVAGMADWVVEMLMPQPVALQPKLTAQRVAPLPDDFHEETPADFCRRTMSFERGLERHGWVDLGGGKWKRPGKTDQGHSAILHNGEVLVIFTTERTRELERVGHPTSDGQGIAVSLFEFFAAYEYGGDLGAASRAVRTTMMPQQSTYDQLREAGFAVSKLPIEAEPDDDLEIDWSTIEKPGPAVIEGFAFAGRWTQVVAKPKQGKSTFIIAASLAAAFGVNPYDGEPQEPVVVWYHDFEMGGLDVKEVLEGDFRLDPKTLAARGWHASVRILALDTPEDAKLLLDKVDQLGVKLVILDGLNGAISGAEKDDVIWRALYRHTIAPLKERGVAVISADNFGKDPTLGPRGSSVKMDKADAVIGLTKTATGVKLEASLARTWTYDKERFLTIHGIDGSEAVHYTRTNYALPPGTRELIQEMNLLGVPLDAGRDRVRKMFEDAGSTAGRNEVVAAALKERRRLARRSETNP